MTGKPCVLLGAPWYTSRPETCFALTQTYLRLAMDGPVYIAGVFDNPSVAHARCRLLAQFMAMPQCTHLLMVDGDMGWHVEAVMRLLGHDVPFVGVPAPDKRDGQIKIGSPGIGGGEKAPYQYDEATGLAEVPRIGACFMLIRRDAVEKMIEAYPHLHLHKDDCDEALRPWYYAFFQTATTGDGWMPSEDFFFCDLLHGAGIPVLADAWVELEHIVPQKLHGKLIDSM